ncbi:anaerobic ribonucleoside-triphosphate reductase activating protein [Methanoregula sp.]|uniref:anaerobic ribonucleoside-triphosphate reductase activating protein n=1 Tax=Methanoregula sp. TaxID=2052170 RepID=UPI003C750DD9
MHSNNPGNKIIRHGDHIQLNFGGFVSLSTVDWRGRSACTVFFRGCPLRCSYCQNEAIQTGSDLRDIEAITDMIMTSSPFISGVVFSGGEPTLQKEALLALARFAKKQHLAVGIQTNGQFPATLEALIAESLADRIAIDYKTRWEGFSSMPGDHAPVPRDNYQKNIKKSIAICKKALREQVIREFEIVITVFYENEEYIKEIAAQIGTIPLVLQQGEHKIGNLQATASDISHGEYISKRRSLQELHPPLTLAEIKKIADELGRTVRIRTREAGEITYESDWRCRDARKRQR